MIDIDLNLMCRICLEDEAIYPIFESNGEFESVYSKLAVCIKEKLENIPGYPTNICIKCKNISETICNFISKFEETCSKLDSQIPKVKTEYIEIMSGIYNDEESAAYELQIDNIVLVKPKVEIKDPTELLEPLKHLTVKRIKLQNDASETAKSSVDDKDVKRKKAKPRKTVAQNSAKNNKPEKKAASKLTTVKKTIARPAGAAKKNGVTKTATNSKTAIDFKNEKIQRLAKIKDILKEKEELIKKREDNNVNVITQRLCDVCGAIFKSSDRLSHHKKYTHGEKKHKCTKCPRAYVSETELKNHILKQHEKVTTVVCDLCGKRYFSKYDLKVHIDTVHRKTKKCAIHKCEFCEKTFKYKRGVIIHERAVHTGERPSTCDVCGSSFYDDVYLKEHMRLHTGDTPHKCPVCARGYAQRGNMKSHMRNHKISELTPDTLAKIKPNYLKFMRP